MTETDIRRNDEAGRYELWLSDELAVFVDYRDEDSVRHFPRTVTQPRFRGRGLAGQLVERALDDATGEGLTVIPSCCFVAGYIDSHPRFQPLVTG
jgi:predicted GNAT family acetyltransferase